MASLIPGKDIPHSTNAPLATRTGKKRRAFPVELGHWPNYCATKRCIVCQEETNCYCISCDVPLCIADNGSVNSIKKQYNRKLFRYISS